MPRDLRGGDRGADAGTAHQDAPLCVVTANRHAHVAGGVRVVHALGVGIDAEIDDLVAGVLHGADDGIPQLHASVIEGDGDLHATRSSSAAACIATFSGVIPSFSSTVAIGAEAP